MANTQLFKSLKAKLVAPNALNHEFAPAYALSAKHQLAQLAATGSLGQTFYATAEAQLEDVLELVKQVDAEFIAKTAIYARQAGFMKDMPALLAAVLAVRDVKLLERVFGRVIDNGKMLRNFVQIVRSGAAGRKSLGTRPKKLVQAWLLAASERQLLAGAVGNSPSLAHVVKMVHPKAELAWQAAWFAWLIGKPYDGCALPPITQAFELFKAGERQGRAVSDVPFQMLTALDLTQDEWVRIARNGSWQMVRQNLNTFARHGVFDVAGMDEVIAAKLADASSIAKARVLPYQLLAAYLSTEGTMVPGRVREALQDAMEVALANVPNFDGRVVVCPDVSGSMHSPVTGYRGSATTGVRCIDVAGLMAAAVLRKNREARVLPFEQGVVNIALNARDSVMTNAQALAAIGGGGTNCSAPLAKLNKERALVDVVVFVSDNESWVDARHVGSTQMMREWAKLKERNPQAKLICIDLQPNRTTQVLERADVMNVGGFSDAVFEMLGRFIAGNTHAEHWVGEVEKVVLDVQ